MEAERQTGELIHKGSRKPHYCWLCHALAGKSVEGVTSHSWQGCAAVRIGHTFFLGEWL